MSIIPPAKVLTLKLNEKEIEIRELEVGFLMEQEANPAKGNLALSFEIATKFSSLTEDEVLKLSQNQMYFVSDKIIKLSGISKDEEEGKH